MPDTPEVPSQPMPDKYNPHIIMGMAKNPLFFNSQLPPVVEELSDLDNAQLTNRPLLRDMRTIMRQLAERGPHELYNYIYGKFVNENQDKSGGVAELWMQYFNRGEVIRDVARGALVGIRQYFDRIQTVLVEYGNADFPIDPETTDFADRLRRAPYQIAYRIFPDMTDDEAQGIFLRDAEDVKKIAQGELDPPPIPNPESD